MAKNKVYAVYSEGQSQLFDSWDACKPHVQGISGVKYKGFAKKAEAEAFLAECKGEAPVGEWLIFVDGSFTPKCEYAGWGIVVCKGKEVLAERYGITKIPALSRNIDGECRGAIEAMKWNAENKKSYPICYDYEGIEAWISGRWKVKSEIAKLYVKVAATFGKKFSFKKVAAHSGIWGNEKADELAKKAISEYLASQTD
jgi:ribonuclease HI